MDPDKFHQRKKLFNDILYEIFNVESNYRTELSVLNLKLLRKIEEHKNKINKKGLDKMRQTIVPTKAISLPERNSNRILSSKSKDHILSENEDNPMIDKLMSEGLQNILTFYKTKHKLISKEVSKIGILLYNFSSSQKKNDNFEDITMLQKYQNDFDLNFVKFMKAKKNYFEKMNNLELFFQDEENKKGKEIKNKQENKEKLKEKEKRKIKKIRKFQ